MIDTQKTNEYLKLKRETAKLFNSKCIGCEKEYEPSFAFHHFQYSDDEKIYSDFVITIDYNLYICPIVQKDPKRFRLVCCECHSIIEIGKKIDFSKLRQCYTLSKKILPIFIDLYCDIWTSHKKDLKQYFRTVFAGKGNILALKFFNEINDGSLDKWESKGLDDFLGIDGGTKHDN